MRWAVPPLLLLLCCCPRVPLPDPLIESPEELRGNIARPESGGTFYAVGRVEYFGQGKARKGKLLIEAMGPDRLRLEVLSFTDDTLAVLVLSPQGFVWFERGEKSCHVGPLCAAGAAAAFPATSQPDLLLALLTGSVPLLRAPERESLAFDREEGAYVLEQAAGELSERVRVEADGRTVRDAKLEESGETVLAVSFSGEFAAGERVLPRQVRLQAPRDDMDLSLEYREAQFGVSFTGDPFAFACPKGTDVKRYECKEGSGEAGQVPGPRGD